jgi:hypothetical protein
MIYGEPGFLALTLSPTPHPVSKLDQRHTGRLRKRDNLLTGEGVGGGGAKSYDGGEKAWYSINLSRHQIYGKPLDEHAIKRCLSFWMIRKRDDETQK